MSQRLPLINTVLLALIVVLLTVQIVTRPELPITPRCSQDFSYNPCVRVSIENPWDLQP